MASAKDFFSEEEKKEIVNAIAQAELNTSGEIRVHVEDACEGDVFKRGIEVFAKLGMHKTDLKNGVLFYFSVKNKKFAIVADKGINDAVKPDFWNVIKEQMQKDFAEQKFSAGLCKAIASAGMQLSTYFPLKEGDKNELSNEISSS